MYLQVYETYNYIIFELLNTWIHEFLITNSEFLGLHSTYFNYLLLFFQKNKLIEGSMVEILEMIDW